MLSPKYQLVDQAAVHNLLSWKSPNSLETKTDRLSMCTPNGSGVVDTSCDFVIGSKIRNAIDCINKYLYVSAISRLRKHTMDPGFAQDNPWIAQIHASRIPCTCVINSNFARAPQLLMLWHGIKYIIRTQYQYECQLLIQL